MDEMVDRLLDILADKLTERLSAGHKELYTAKELAERYGVSYPCFHIAYTSLSCGAIAATPIQISQCLPSELRFHSPPSVSNAAIMP